MLLDESAAYGDETGVAEDTAEGFSLNLLGRFALRAPSAWKRAVAIFEEVSANYPYDLLIGDETYEINAALGKRPELKKAPFVMIYDFVGLDAMSLNPLERLITYQGNWAWVGGPRGKQPTQQDLTLFIGEPEDVPDRRSAYCCPTAASTPAATTTSSATPFPSTLPITQTRRRCEQHLATTKSGL